MRRKGSECTRISPAEIGAGTPMLSLASRSSGRRAPSSSSDRDRPRQVRGGGGVCGSRLLRTARWTAARLYRRARVSIVRAFRSSSPSTRTKKAAAAAATAASPDCTPARHSSRRQQQQSAPPVVVVDDSHKSEAVEECIRFMNSSSRKYR